MLSKDDMQAKAENIKQQVEQSLAKCNEAKNELERMYGNHNALLGAQLLANQLLQELGGDIATPAVALDTPAEPPATPALEGEVV